MFTLYSNYVHTVFTLCSYCSHYFHTMFTLFILFTLCSHCVHTLIPHCSNSVHSVFTLYCVLRSYSLCSVFTQFPHYALTLVPPSVSTMHSHCDHTSTITFQSNVCVPHPRMFGRSMRKPMNHRPAIINGTVRRLKI